MYFRLRLSPDLQKLVLFDINESHNHGIDPNTTQLPPRQQVYRLNRMRKGQAEPAKTGNINTLIASAIKDGKSNISFSLVEILMFLINEK